REAVAGPDMDHALVAEAPAAVQVHAPGLPGAVREEELAVGAAQVGDPLALGGGERCEGDARGVAAKGLEIQVDAIAELVGAAVAHAVRPALRVQQGSGEQQHRQGGYAPVHATDRMWSITSSGAWACTQWPA